MEAARIGASLSVDGGVAASMAVDGGLSASLSVGAVALRDGTTDYERLSNKPSIEDVELSGNRTLAQLGVKTLSVQEIERILYLGEEI